jgi:hypothetical protein
MGLTSRSFYISRQLRLRICHEESPRNKERLQFSGKHKLLFSVDYANLLTENMNFRKKNISGIRI